MNTSESNYNFVEDAYTYIDHYWKGTDQDDLLIYKGGNDTINGKKGSDVLSINANYSEININTFESLGLNYITIGDTTIRSFNTETLLLNDITIGLNSSETNYNFIEDAYTYIDHYWEGTDQDDLLIYKGGNDTINGKNGNDILSINAKDSEVTITSTEQNSTIINYKNSNITISNIEHISLIDKEYQINDINQL